MTAAAYTTRFKHRLVPHENRNHRQYNGLLLMRAGREKGNFRMLELLFALLVVIVAVVLLGPRLLMRWSEGQVRREMEHAKTLQVADADPVLADLDPARPTLLYFTADWCGPCRTTQAPIIEKLTTELGDKVQLRTVDIVEDPAAADRWGVKSLPRTFVLRPGLEVHATNIDVASAQTLHEQIEAARSAAGGEVAVHHEKPAAQSGGGFKMRLGKPKQ
jgi:thioredoxin 1